MEWSNLLCPSRLGRGDATDSKHRLPFQRDFDRVIFSSAFRRLQDKTQVFPLSQSDYVRTRLTHSLEVASVGRSLGTELGLSVLNTNQNLNAEASDFGAIVAAACLAHDIGNPPFGHSGEDAIRHFFKENPLGQSILSQMGPAEKADFESFEGNAQAFRILSRLQHPDNPGGLQLSLATLASLIKYPHPGHKKKKGCRGRKMGFFLADQPLFQTVASGVGLIELEPEYFCRHPLAFLVEAADDISYHVVDIEDGLRLSLVSFDEASQHLLAIFETPEQNKIRNRVQTMTEDKERISYIRARCIAELIEQSSKTAIQHLPSMLDGTLDTELIELLPCHEALKAIEILARNKIYCAREVIEIEAAGFEILNWLLETFGRALEEHSAGKPSLWSRKILQLFPKQFFDPEGKPEENPYLRALKLTDFVSGMTDSYAVSLFQKLRGSSVGG